MCVLSISCPSRCPDVPPPSALLLCDLYRQYQQAAAGFGQWVAPEGDQREGGE